MNYLTDNALSFLTASLNDIYLRLAAMIYLAKFNGMCQSENEA